MKQLVLISLLFTFFSYSQTQIGSDIDGEALGDRSGSTVVISDDGNTIAVSALRNGDNGADSGHVRVYENLSGVWTQIGADIDGEAVDDYSGYSLSLSSDGSILAIGTPGNDGNGLGSGHVRIYENLSGVWTQIGDDIDGVMYDHLGESVSLSSDGSILATGAIYSLNSGKVQVYKNISGVWTQIANDIKGEADGDKFGCSVSLSSDGSIIAIGAYYNGSIGIRSGHVRVYTNISGVWTQIGADIDGKAEKEQFGYSVSLSSNGNILAVGATLNNGTERGKVRVYKNIGNVWTQVGTDINGEYFGDSFGCSVSLSGDGNILAIGARFNYGFANQAGHVRIYQNVSNVWTQIGVDIDGKQISEFSGHSISLSSDGGTVIVGAPYNNTNGNESGQSRVYDLTSLLSLEDNVVSKNFTVYPNPVKEQLHLQLSNSLEFKNVKIYNGFGQNILESIKTTIDLSSLSTGIYFVLIETNQGKAVKKIIKE
jgi:Flp pilus assembly pilin Flp